MKTVYKYPLQLPLSEYYVLDIPRGAQFLHVDIQNDIICLWAMVDTEAAMSKRQIRVVGTGLDAGDVKSEQHIGSVLVLNGTYVFHIFDVGEVLQ